MRAVATQSIIFDTLQYSKRLQKEGVPPNQADVQAEMIKEIFDDHIATKGDIRVLEKELKKDMIAMEERLSNRITEMGYKLTIRLLGTLGSLFIASIVVLGFVIHLSG